MHLIQLKKIIDLLYTSGKVWKLCFRIASALVALFLLISPVDELVAQTGAEVSISVSATVTSTIEMITIQAMDFTGEELELSVVEINPVLNPNAGRMVARGNPNAEMRLNFVQTQQLRNTLTNSILTIQYLVAGNSIDEQVTADLLGEDDRDLQFNSDGEFYIWVGATIDLSEAEPGSYESEFSIEVEYI